MLSFSVGGETVSSGRESRIDQDAKGGFREKDRG